MSTGSGDGSECAGTPPSASVATQELHSIIPKLDRARERFDLSHRARALWHGPERPKLNGKSALTTASPPVHGIASDIVSGAEATSRSRVSRFALKLTLSSSSGCRSAHVLPTSIL